MATGGASGKGAAGGGNVYTGAADALTGAASGLKDAASLYGNPGMTGPAPTYDPTTAGLPGKISAGIAGYMNPYTDTVINNATSDISRLTGIQQEKNAAEAVNAGAFGGDRHGLVEAQTNAEAQRNIGNLSGVLREAGFKTAAGLSAQDITNLMQGKQFNAGVENEAGRFNAGQESSWAAAKSADEIARAAGLVGASGAAEGLGKTGFNIAQTLMGNQAAAGEQQQQLVQSLMTLAGGQYQNFMQRPQEMIQLLMSAAGMSPLNNMTKTTENYQPGLLDYLSLAGQTLTGYLGAPKAPATIS
jgi:hypothetical protein